MRIELTVKADYLPTWGLYEGIRELIQNGKDAETEFNAKLEVRHRKESSTLVIENDGAVIPHEALLFGHTTKSEREDMIGKFGEGLKLGVLALVRSGFPVRIRSGSEVWVPKIERSEKFKADVLVINTEKGRADKERVQIEVGNITSEDWNRIRTSFLFLTTFKKDERIATEHGALLLSGEHIGRLYVKGIFVEHDPKLAYGYDLSHGATLDRDRKMIQRYDLHHRLQSIWSVAAKSRPDLMNKFVDMLDNDSADISGIDEYNAHRVSDELRTEALKVFRARHGEDAIPVASLAESADVDHLGKKGIVLSKPHRTILQVDIGTVEKVKQGLRNEVVRTYSWHDLSQVQKDNLRGAITLVTAVEPVTLEEIDIVDFRDPKLMGMYKDGRVLLTEKHLADQDTLLEILVHECAHRNGSGDGEHSHVARIEKLWGGIVKNLRARVTS